MPPMKLYADSRIHFSSLRTGVVRKCIPALGALADPDRLHFRRQWARELRARLTAGEFCMPSRSRTLYILYLMTRLLSNEVCIVARPRPRCRMASKSYRTTIHDPPWS